MGYWGFDPLKGFSIILEFGIIFFCILFWTQWQIDPDTADRDPDTDWLQVTKTFFMLSSTEHTISTVSLFIKTNMLKKKDFSCSQMLYLSC